MKNRTTVSLLGLGLLLTSFMITPRLASAVDVPDSKEVTKLLVQAKAQALQLKQDAEILESFTHSDISRQSHACAADQVAADIDALTHQVAKLDEAVKAGSPWQKDAVEHIKPVAYDLVSNADAVIRGINKGGCLTGGDYADYVRANVTLSDRLLATVKQYVDTSRQREKLDR